MPNDEEMMTEKTKPVIIAELWEKEADSIDPIEVQREMQKNYLNDLHEAVRLAKEKTTQDFYVVGILRQHTLLTRNHLEHKFVTRHTCPTPTYDQTVWKYRALSGDLEYMWTVPDRETCEIYLTNAIKVVPEERQLLNYIIDFANGTLLERAKKENGETKDLNLEFFNKKEEKCLGE